jgi:hypothetical protein
LPFRAGTVRDRGKTVTKHLALTRLGLPLSEKQIPQVVENLESGGNSKKALETAALRPRQVRYIMDKCLGVAQGFDRPPRRESS